MEGVNSRLDGLQASLLSAKLPHLPAWTAARRRIAGTYDRLLADVPQVERPRVRPGSTHVFHLYVVKVPRRDELRQHLAQQGIETAIHYPVALPAMPAYAYLGTDLATVERAVANTKQILSLPIFPEMANEMVEYVVDRIRGFYAR